MKNTTEITNSALEAGAHSAALDCYDAKNFTTAITEDGTIQYMPGGLHTITPSQGGRAVTVTVMVDADSADAIEQERQEIVARNKSPYFSITHENQIAGFRPTKFYWAARPDVTGKLSEGVWADGEWTASGKAARDGKDYKFFSPTFFVSSTTDNPATVICNPAASVIMGSLVNDPAFDKISPLFAKDASGETLEAGGRGSGRVDYTTARDAAVVSDLSASLASQRALSKGSPAANRAAADAHKDAVTRHEAAGELGISDGTKTWHKKMVDLHSGMGDFHESCADCAPTSVIPAQLDEKPAPNAASDASTEHATLLSVESFAEAHNAAVQASDAANVAIASAAPALHIASLSAAESKAWENIADWAERNNYLLAGQGYREAELLAKNASEVWKELALNRR
jgi:hypothetical protein